MSSSTAKSAPLTSPGGDHRGLAWAFSAKDENVPDVPIAAFIPAGFPKPHPSIPSEEGRVTGASRTHQQVTHLEETRVSGCVLLGPRKGLVLGGGEPGLLVAKENHRRWQRWKGWSPVGGRAVHPRVSL